MRLEERLLCTYRVTISANDVMVRRVEQHLGSTTLRTGVRRWLREHHYILRRGSAKIRYLSGMVRHPTRLAIIGAAVRTSWVDRKDRAVVRDVDLRDLDNRKAPL